MQPERRRSERVDVFLIVEFRPFGKKVEYTQGVTENISAKGFSFDSQNHQFDPGEFIEIRLKHPQREISVSVAGEILWKRESWYKCVTGIRYRDLDSDTELSLNELVSAASNKDVEPATPQSDSISSEKESPDEKPNSVQEAEMAGEKTENEIKADSERTVTNGLCFAEGFPAVDSGIDNSISNAALKAEPSAEYDNNNLDDKQLKDSSLKEVRENKEIVNKKGHRSAMPKTAETRKNRKPFYMTFAAVFIIVFAVVLSGKFKGLYNVLVSTPSIPVEDVDENDLLGQYEDISSGNLTRTELTEPVQAGGIPGNSILPDEGELNTVKQLPSEIITEQEIAEDIGPGVVSGNEERFYSSSIREASLPVASFETQIVFGRNSDVVNPAFDPEIDKIALLLINNPAAAAILEGYTDNIGPAVYNIDLSIRRANAVRDLLVLRGIDSSRIETAGIGDSNPVSSNETLTGRSRNRRVKIRINYSGD